MRPTRLDLAQALINETAARARAHAALSQLDNPIRFARKALEDELRSRSATLRPVMYEDALGRTVRVLVELARRYDPTRGGSFSTYAYPILRRRYTDFLREERVDSRYTKMPDLVSIDASPTDHGAGALDEQEIAALIEEIDHDKLSSRARGALREIARRIVEDGLSAAEASAAIAKGAREGRNDLKRLKAELAA